jgi:hypothetical protein
MSLLSPLRRARPAGHRSANRKRSPKKVKPPFRVLRVEELETRLAPAGVLQSVDPANFAGGIDASLIHLEQSVTQAVNQVGNLPLIGNKLTQAVQPVVNLFEQGRTQLDQLVQNVLTQLRDNPNADALSIFNSGLYRVFGPQGLGILRHDVSGGSVPSTSPSDIVVTQGHDTDSQGNAVPNTDFFQWDMHLGQQFSVDVPFNLGIDLPPALQGIGFHLDNTGGVRIQFQ